MRIRTKFGSLSVSSIPGHNILQAPNFGNLECYYSCQESSPTNETKVVKLQYSLEGLQDMALPKFKTFNSLTRNRALRSGTKSVSD